jgi:hypothetical protein
MHIGRKQSIRKAGERVPPVPLHQAGAIRIHGHFFVTSAIRARGDFHPLQFLLGHATCAPTVLAQGEY